MVGLSTSQVDSADLLRADVEERKQKKNRGSHGMNGIFTYMNDMDPSIKNLGGWFQIFLMFTPIYLGHDPI